MIKKRLILPLLLIIILFRIKISNVKKFHWIQRIGNRYFHRTDKPLPHIGSLTTKQWIAYFNDPINIKLHEYDNFRYQVLKRMIGKKWAGRVSLLISGPIFPGQYTPSKEITNFYRQSEYKIYYGRYRAKRDHYKMLVKSTFTVHDYYKFKFNFYKPMIQEYAPFAIGSLLLLLAITVNPMFGFGVIGYYVADAAHGGVYGAAGTAVAPWDEDRWNDEWNAGNIDNSVVHYCDNDSTFSNYTMTLNSNSEGTGAANIIVDGMTWGTGTKCIIYNHTATGGNDRAIRETADYVHMIGFDLQYADLQQTWLEGSHLIMDQIDTFDADQGGLWHYANNGQEDVVYKDCTGSDTSGALVMYGRGPYVEARGTGYTLMEGSTAWDCNDNIQWHHSEGWGELQDYHIIRECESYDSNEEGWDNTAGRQCLWEDNYTHENGRGMFITGNDARIIINRRNQGWDEGNGHERYGSAIMTEDTEVYNNVIQVAPEARRGLMVSAENKQEPNNVHIHCNTFLSISVTFVGQYQGMLNVDNDIGSHPGNIANIYYYGNINVTPDGKRNVYLKGIAAGDANTVFLDYNLYWMYNTDTGYWSASNGNGSTLADWQTAVGEDMNSAWGDPLFVDITGVTYGGNLTYQNYLLDVGSPAIALGSPSYTAHMSAWADPYDAAPWLDAETRITLDYQGDARDATNPDSGFDEKNGAPPPPPGTYIISNVKITNCRIRSP